MMIVRPLDPSKAEARGLSIAEQHIRSQAALDAIADLAVYEYVDATDEYIVEIPLGETENGLHRRLMATGNFEYVEPNWIVAPVGCPNDPRFGSQWHHTKIGSCTAWNYSTGSTGITVAVCDTGVRTSHVDLTGLNREGYNVITRVWESAGGQIADINGHGTGTAGVAAARGNNAAGVSGMGWTRGYRPIRVSNTSNGFSDVAYLTAAARTACESGDKVISVSYAGVQGSSVEATGAYLRSKGSLLVWAAGNSGQMLDGVRADNVIVVGAVNQSDTLVSTPIWASNYGPRVDFVAPGIDIWTTSNTGNTSYAPTEGTSFATPMVAGLCGLVWSRNPSLTPAQVEAILRASAVDLGAAGPDNTFGYGRINAASALAMTTPASRFTLWATSVPETASPANTVWENESYAAGTETCDDCNSSTCQYSINSTNGNTTPLTANDFQTFTMPSGQRIVKVEVEVSARYNTNTTANLAIRAFAPNYAVDSGWRNTPAFISGNRCASRAGSVGDITSLSSNWTAAMVNNLQLQVRRQGSLSGNTLRVVSMRVIVTTAPI